MEISYPVWLPKTFGSQQNADEMNGLVQVLQNHAENISEQHKRLVASSGGIYPGKISTTSTLPSDLSQGVFLVTQPGTYKNFGNVVLPAADSTNNYMGFIFWDGTSFSLDYFPIAKPDMTAVNSAIEKMDEFIENFKPEVNQKIIKGSELAVSSEAVINELSYSTQDNKYTTLNISSQKTKYFSDSSKSFVTDVAWETSDFIAVKKGQKVKAKLRGDTSKPIVSFFKEKTTESFVEVLKFNESTTVVKNTEFEFSINNDGYILFNNRFYQYTENDLYILISIDELVEVKKQYNGEILHEKFSDIEKIIKPLDIDYKINSRINSENIIVEPLVSLNNYINSNGVLVQNDTACFYSFKVKKGDCLYINSTSIKGTQSIMQDVNGKWNNINNRNFSDNRQLYESIVIKDDSIIYVNQNIGDNILAPTIVINRLMYEYTEDFENYLSLKDSEFSIDSYTDISLLLLSNGFFNLNSSIGTAFGRFSGTDNLFTSQLIPVKGGQTIKCSGKFGGVNGVALFDDKLTYIEKVIDGTDVFVEKTAVIKKDGFLLVSLYKADKNKLSISNLKKIKNSNSNTENTIDDFKNLKFLYAEKPKFGKIILSNGYLPTDSTDTRQKTTLDFNIYGDDRKVIASGICEMSIQGHGSATYQKKGYTFDLYNKEKKSLDIKFGEMVATDSFHLKAYQTDRTHTRDVGNGRLWKEIISSNTYPYNSINTTEVSLSLDKDKNELFTAEASYYTNGFPIELYLDENFIGLYTVRLKKKRENYGLNNKNLNHIFLDSSTYTAFLSKSFNPSDWDLKSPKISGYNEAGEIPNEDVLAKCQRLFEFTKELNTRYTEHADFINLQHWIDWIIFSELISNRDSNGNNYNLVTYDGVKWSIIPYDLDLTIGLNAWPSYNIELKRDSFDVSHDIWGVFKTRFSSEISARYKELKNNGIIKTSNIIKNYRDIAKNIPQSVYQQDRELWGNLWKNGESDISQIELFLDNKIKFLDSKWL